MKRETERWLRRAEADLSVAELAFAHGFLDQCFFHCHQALEKLLKGLWVETNEWGEPPRTHSLVRLSLSIADEMADSQKQLLQRLTEQYIPSRYGDLAPQYTAEETADRLRQAQELFAWLRQRLN